jgi:hypothetical protein
MSSNLNLVIAIDICAIIVAIGALLRHFYCENCACCKS